MMISIALVVSIIYTISADLIRGVNDAGFCIGEQ